MLISLYPLIGEGRKEAGRKRREGRAVVTLSDML